MNSAKHQKRQFVKNSPMYKSMFVLLISPDAANNLPWTLKLSQCGGEENFWEAVSEKNDQLGTALEVEVKV